ncbi:MAG TPA: D-glycerate dehydrogenase [Pseudogracilibacillus sp.]|nr:D-glycerate dehydrogenase [Pseudogracilibacillus sp.]
MKRNIYITRRIPDYLLEPYQEKFNFRMWQDSQIPVPKDVFYEESLKADGILCLLTETIDYDFLNHASHLKIIANTAVGYDNVDVDAANELGITVTNTPDVLTETTADLAFALLMATARRIVESSKFIYDDKWSDWSPFQLAGTDIFNKTVGIVGMGRIGTAVARRAKGFNMKVLYHNRTRNEAAEEEVAATYVSFEHLLAESDFVISLVPLSEATENMFNRQVFEQMKESAIFINVSRGGVVDEADLYEVLKEEVIKAAGLDVFVDEPISGSHPFTKLNNAVLTPHIGSATKETREKMLTLCLDNLEATFFGEGPLTPVTK